MLNTETPSTSLDTGLLAEMRKLPPLKVAALPEPSLDVSLLIPARGAAHALAKTVEVAQQALQKSFPGSFEIVLIPNPSLRPKPGSTPDRSIEISEELAKIYPEVRVQTHRWPQGKGAALRTGFQASRGRWVFFTDADLPYDLSFFEVAAQNLKSGFDFVTGNRRLLSSVFDLPVDLLSLAYGRHRLGLAFNRVVRWLLPIHTTDTQAGIKAMSRRLAAEGFARQSCPGFFFDLEFFLTSAGLGYSHVELPVTLKMNSEKSTVRVLRESVLAGFWLTRITLRNLVKRAYGSGKKGMETPRTQKVRPLKRYRDTQFSTQVFLQARWRLTPYSQMVSKLPPRGKVLDLGCGHGLFSLAAALGSSEREVIGLDHDQARIELAKKAAQGLSNLRYAQGTLSDPEQTGAGLKAASIQGISMIDVMHYFPEKEQERLFAQAFELLAPGGVLLVREVNPGEGAASTLNRFYEKMATASGFTRSERKTDLCFRTRDQWEEVLRKTGFEVTSERCSHFLFADVLYVCRKGASVSI